MSSARSSSVAILTLRLIRSRDNRWWLRDIPAEDVALDEVGKPHGELVADELARRNGEDLCGGC